METNAPANNNLLKMGGAAGLVCALVYFAALLVYLPAYQAGPPPATVAEWFALFLHSPITGLFFLGLADLVIVLFWAPMGLALYAVLKRCYPTAASLAFIFILIGIAVFIASNPAFSMLSLSRDFARAADPSEQAEILAAGKAMLAMTEGTSKIPLVWLSGLAFSVMMLPGSFFQKTTGWVGIVGMGLLVASVPLAGYATTGTMSPLQGALIAITYSGGGILSLAWYVLVGLRLLKLGRSS